MAIILSVIIPTTGERNLLLDRAVSSALECWSNSEVEVIIVLNRNLENKSELELRYSSKRNVSVVVSKKIGVSAARNFGLTKAAGKLIRFLDDDDYLYGAEAKNQCLNLLNSDVDFSSCAIDLINESGRFLSKRSPVDCEDPFVGLTTSQRLQIPLSFVYKRSAIESNRWDEQLSLAEDTTWLLGLLRKEHLKWIQSNKVIGVWYQHTSSRLSRRYSSSQSSKSVAAALLLLIDSNLADNSDKVASVADGLWSCVVAGFKFDPTFWHGVIRRLMQLAPDTYPDSMIYKTGYRLGLSPLVMSWCLLPFFKVLLWLRRGEE